MSCDGRRVRRREGRGVRGVGEWGVVRRRAHPVRPVVLEAAAVDLSGAVVRGQTRSGIVGDEAARDCGGGVLQQHQPVQAVAPHAAVGGLEARAGRGGAPKVHVGAERLSRNAAAVGAGHLVAVERGAHEQDGAEQFEWRIGSEGQKVLVLVPAGAAHRQTSHVAGAEEAVMGMIRLCRFVGRC